MIKNETVAIKIAEVIACNTTVQGSTKKEAKKSYRANCAILNTVIESIEENEFIGSAAFYTVLDYLEEVAQRVEEIAVQHAYINKFVDYEVDSSRMAIAYYQNKLTCKVMKAVNAFRNSYRASENRKEECKELCQKLEELVNELIEVTKNHKELIKQEL